MGDNGLKCHPCKIVNFVNQLLINKINLSVLNQYCASISLLRALAGMPDLLGSAAICHC